jgi:hypothetical protein
VLSRAGQRKRDEERQMQVSHDYFIKGKKEKKPWLANARKINNY